MAETLRKYSGDEFVRRMREGASSQETQYAFFLGAGCSISSNIPAAAELTEKWLTNLHKLRAPLESFDKFAKETFPTCDTKNPGALYGEVMKELFPYPEQRRMEIENQCKGKYPGFGYSILAKLMSPDDGCRDVYHSGAFNVVLTTNFDDLVADALYLFASVKPLVINHETLSKYTRATPMRPLLIKLHGDHLLSPLNTGKETEKINEGLTEQVKYLLNNRGLVFIGYGGNDKGIYKMLNELPESKTDIGIYWVGSKPGDTILPWLKSKNATWVEINDFDQLMLLFFKEFSISKPDNRFKDIFDQYFATFEKMTGKVEQMEGKAPDAVMLKEAAKQASDGFSADWSQPFLVDAAARRYINKNNERANSIYLLGLEKFPNSFILLNNYAAFLTRNSKDYDRAGEYYLKALNEEPENAAILCNYAVFLTNIRRDDVKAEEFYKRALDADPNHANNLGNYAGLLLAADRKSEGLTMLLRAFESARDTTQPDLLSELWFYAFAHRNAERRPEALSNLKKVLLDGGRSPGWDFSGNIKRAALDGHEDAEWLQRLADVITEKQDIKILNEWPKWREV